MTTSSIDALPIDSLVAASMATAASVVGVTFDAPEIPFTTEAVDDRLAEIDAQLGAPALSFGGSAPGTADPARVAPPVRGIPGGDAFAELLDLEPAAMTFGLVKRVKELYRRVREFLVRLRDGLFGFDRVLFSDASVRASLESSLDSDVGLSIAGGTLGEPLDGRVAGALGLLVGSLADALAVFAKVVEIVAAVVKAASNPVSAVRALWRALVALYELLVAHLESRAAA